MAQQFDEIQARCGACFGSTQGVREERVNSYPAALARYMTLSAVDQTARVCAQPNGQWRVCHRPESA